MRLLLTTLFISISVISFGRKEELITAYKDSCFIFRLSDIDTTQFSGTIFYEEQVFVIKTEDLHKKSFERLRNNITEIVIIVPKNSEIVLTFDPYIFSNLRYFVLIGYSKHDDEHRQIFFDFSTTPVNYENLVPPGVGKKFKGFKSIYLPLTIRLIAANFLLDLHGDISGGHLKIRKLSQKKVNLLYGVYEDFDYLK